MDIDRRAIVSPALILQSLVVILGGLAVYYSTIGELKEQLIKIDEGHHTIVSRIQKMENVTDTCSLTKYQSDMQEKDIEELSKKLKEFDERLREHDDVTKKLLPLGRRSELEPLKIN